MSEKVIGKQNISKLCMVCGLENEFSLKMRFFDREDGSVIGVFTGKNEHQSYPGRMHGGMISAILDETIGRVLTIGNRDCWAVTVELNVRFTHSVPLETQLTCIGKATRDTKRVFEGSGEIMLPDGTVCAKATAKYVKMPAGTIADCDIKEYWLPDEKEIPEFLQSAEGD